MAKNKQVEQVFRYITEENKDNINYFYMTKLLEEFKKIDIYESLTLTELSNPDDIDALLNYSGINYKNINAALRGNWNYELNGNISLQEQYRELGYQIRDLINKNPTILNENIITYRGVDISYFRDYGIDSLEDLKSLEDYYLYDSGLVSTSIDEKTSYFKKENDFGLNYNIKIEYMIPKEFKDGIYLNKEMSYNPEQQEYLINAGNISKVQGVTINDDNTAVIKTMLIPKEIYDDYYKDKGNITK